ncbi:venom metalloproteinase 3-like [Leptopilina heterotoma]|uniref:venom metalloproteinase 3-like n=1 Tax=Leptopilina heterotoma TaxID=63436 RepID=UPI001CA85A0F|nr:venom metalloproteinase 3-like [Leptopilina heterotoma]
MIYISILLCAFIPSLTRTLQIQQLADYDMQRLFYGDQKEASDYEVVSVKHSLNKRSTTELSINVKINGVDKQFILQSVKGYFAGKDTKVWLAKKVGDKFEYTLQKDFMEKVNISFYHDEETQSTITHSVNEEGISEFNGIIDFDKVIRPFEFDRRKRRTSFEESFVNINKDNVKNHHIIHKRELHTNSKVIINNDPDVIRTEVDRERQKTEDSVLEKPDAVYPEILVYVDTTLFSYFNNDIIKTLAYTLTLWNGVDLNYRDVKNPLVRLNIAGIVLCQDQIISTNPFAITKQTLVEFSKFMYNEDEFKLGEDYDIAVLLGANPDFDYGIEGLAHLSGGCVIEEQLTLSTMLVVDNSKLSGINTAAHELAHLFGAPEDGEYGDSTINAPGAENCFYDGGYLMSIRAYDRRQFSFSSCTKDAMSYFFSHERAKCLLNNPAVNRTDKQILRILPGKYMTIDEQCQKNGFRKAVNMNPDICTNIQCANDGNIPEELNVAALEGTPCDYEKDSKTPVTSRPVFLEEKVKNRQEDQQKRVLNLMMNKTKTQASKTPITSLPVFSKEKHKNRQQNASYESLSLFGRKGQKSSERPAKKKNSKTPVMSLTVFLEEKVKNRQEDQQKRDSKTPVTSLPVLSLPVFWDEKVKNRQEDQQKKSIKFNDE